MLCQYKDIFGKPGEGAHSIRVGNLAVVDIVLTIIVAWIIAYYFNLNKFVVIGSAFVIGIIAHRLFCVRTQVDKILFSE